MTDSHSGQLTDIAAFGDYVVYVDESGDHSLAQINNQYPIFALAFCIVEKSTFAAEIVPAFQTLKFKFFGHDMVVFHEHEITKGLGEFAFLRREDFKPLFFSDLNRVMEQASFNVVATVIDKYKYRQTAYVNDNPYRVALQYGMERIYFELQKRGQTGRLTYVIFESRGKKEDKELNEAFAAVLKSTKLTGMAATLRFKVAEKKVNSTGLQLADLVARPIGLRVLRPHQKNRAYDIIRPKLSGSDTNSLRGHGIKVIP